MDNSLHFVLTGDNSQLLDTLNQSKQAMDMLAQTASKYGMSVEGAMSVVTQHMRNASESGKTLAVGMNIVSEAMEQNADSAKNAQDKLSDLSTKYIALNSDLNQLQVEMNNTAVDDVQRMEELRAKIEEVKEQIAETRSALASGLDSTGVKMEISSGDSVDMADSGSSVGNTEQVERLNTALEETAEKFRQIQSELNSTSESFEKLINTSDSKGGDMFNLAENKDKIDAIKERLHSLDEGYAAASDNLMAMQEAIQQAVKDGDTQQAKALENTAAQVYEARHKIEEETTRLQDIQKKLKDENANIKNAVKGSSDAFGKEVAQPIQMYAKGLDGAFSGLGQSFGQISQGFKMVFAGGASAAKGVAMLKAGFEALFATLVKNPLLLAAAAALAAIIGVVNQVSAAFKRNEDAMTGLQRIAAPFKALWQAIQRMFDDIVGVLVKVADNIRNTAGATQVLHAIFVPFAKIIAAVRAGVALLGTALVDVAKIIRVAANAFAEFSHWLSNTRVGDWARSARDGFKEFVAPVTNFFNYISDWVSTLAKSKWGKKFGLDELLTDLKKINNAQDELAKTNSEIADLENARNKRARAYDIDNAKHQANLTKLRREYAEASGNIAKQDKISKKITEEEKAIKKNDLDLAKMELDIIKKKNSILQAGSKDRESESRAEAKVIRLQAEYDYGMSSQERRTQRRSQNDSYSKLKSELASERDLRLEAYKQEKIDARDSRDALQKIEMEEFNFKQEMKKKELDLQLKFHKISKADYDTQLQQMAAAAETHRKEVESGNFDFFRNASRKLEFGINNKNNIDQQKEEIENLKEQLKYEENITRKQELRNQIRERELKIELQQIELEKRKAILDTYKEDGLRQYDEGKLNDIAGVTGAYDQKAANARAKSERKGAQEDFYEDYQAYLDYSNKIIEIAEWRANELDKIEAGESALTQEQVDKIFNDRVNDAAKNANIDDLENTLTTKLSDFTQKIAYASLAGIDEAWKNFQNEMEEETIKVNAKIALNDDEKRKVKAAITADTDIINSDVTTQEEKDAAAERMIANEQLLVDLDKERNALEEDLTRIKGMTLIAQQQQLRQSQNSNELSKKFVNDFNRNTKASVSALGSMKSIAGSLADVFGKNLSKSAKAALSAIMEIADAGMQAVRDIQQIVSTATNGMKVTAEGGVEAMKQLEKASFILAILSAALRIGAALAKLFSQFTAAAKLQKAINKQKNLIKDLEHEHKKLERAYKNSSGSSYYKSLSKSAEDYNNLIKANETAIEKAGKLYGLQVVKYGKNSKKAKKAKKQLQELQDQQAEFEEAQKEQYNELMESLSGTSLKSFSENLADALIEGFEQGRDGVGDVWENTMDDIMRTMMKQQLAIAIEDMFKPVFEQLNEYTKNGELTQSEIDSIMAAFDAQSERAKYLAEQYYNLMSERGLLDDADVEGSKGFGQMTQDQADTLTARFTALQMEGANLVTIGQLMQEALLSIQGITEQQATTLQNIYQYNVLAFQLAQERLDQLQIIADNTSLLAETNTRLKAIEQHTEKL